MDYKVKLDVFEGPMDLLLHLIRKNEIDIYDISIAVITDQYLEYLDLMRSLNLDIVGDFLLMASNLIHIKSKMLLPPSEDDEEELEDPRDELVRNLLEYQKFQEGARLLNERLQLGRDTFAKSLLLIESLPDEGNKEEELQAISIVDLLDAFKEILERAPASQTIEIQPDNLSIVDKIDEILGRLKVERVVDFYAFFNPLQERKHLILTFLAILELIRQRLIKVEQTKAFGKITLYLPEEM
jgi:segregation and condensation protein A